jgi:hypothetical protein
MKSAGDFKTLDLKFTDDGGICFKNIEMREKLHYFKLLC